MTGEYGQQQGSRAATVFGVSTDESALISQNLSAQWPAGLVPAGGMHLGDLCDISIL